VPPPSVSKALEASVPACQRASVFMFASLRGRACAMQGKALFMRLDVVEEGLASLRSGADGLPAEPVSCKAVDDALEAAESQWSGIMAIAQSHVRGAACTPYPTLSPDPSFPRVPPMGF
jgi:hypothetical protein